MHPTSGGNAVPNNASAIGVPYLFTGRRYDYETGYYCRAAWNRNGGRRSRAACFGLRGATNAHTPSRSNAPRGLPARRDAWKRGFGGSRGGNAIHPLLRPHGRTLQLPRRPRRMKALFIRDPGERFASRYQGTYGLSSNCRPFVGPAQKLHTSRAGPGL